MVNIGFLAVALALALAVLAVLLRPLWREARGVGLAIGALVLVSTGLLYRIVGTPDALNPAALRAPETIGEAIAQLERSLARDPGQKEGWMLLGMAYQRQGELAKSRDAYARAARLAPADPDALTEAAQSRALAAPDRRFDAEAVAMLQAALKASPDHQRARWFLGVAQRQAGDNAAAAATWEPLLGALQGGTADTLRSEVNAARAAAGLAPLAPSASAATADTGALQVKVALDPGFAARVRLDGNAHVFVIARQPGGPPMPVAVERHGVADLPFTATLDDADSPMPTLKLSQLREVELVARLSASGNAMKQDGDVESAPVSVVLPAKDPVTLRIGAP
ncbi:tetratricopeptide repeat protein [Thermomonas sp.]|uniref:tetratricopeptide repeat protein n=1 Tax=Thermomonas sp. TaxID=1971895 RepID=UPI0035ADC693